MPPLCLSLLPPPPLFVLFSVQPLLSIPSMVSIARGEIQFDFGRENALR